MEIRYTPNGRIISCIHQTTDAEGDGILQVHEADLPEDFLTTFALGKYMVRKGKIVVNKKFALPPT